MASARLFLSFPEDLVNKPILYEAVKRFDVMPNIRRANVESHSGWVILELSGEDANVEEAIAYFREVGVSVNRMEGDILES
jgi:ABC-type methionine transport system ATPase subunit